MRSLRDPFRCSWKDNYDFRRTPSGPRRGRGRREVLGPAWTGSRGKFEAWVDMQQFGWQPARAPDRCLLQNLQQNSSRRYISASCSKVFHCFLLRNDRYPLQDEKVPWLNLIAWLIVDQKNKQSSPVSQSCETVTHTNISNQIICEML